MKNIKLTGKIVFLLCFLLACMPAFAQTERVSDFNDFLSALNKGSYVRVVINYARCSRPAGKSGITGTVDAITGMDIDTYEYFAAGAIHNKNAYVVFSVSKLIQNPHGKGFVYNYGKVRINDDNTAVITVKYIHPKSFKVLMDESYNGNLNEGISLFVKNN